MADKDEARRQAERMVTGSREIVPSFGMAGDPFYPPPPDPGAVQWLTESERKTVEQLIALEPDLTGMVNRNRAWSLVTETLKKIAIFLTTLAGGFYVLREIIQGMAG